jgi:hypothetical protein
MVMSLSTPVALFIFNRPDLTRVAFEAIAQVRPRKLLVVADGPRTPEEAEKCRQARAISERVDWPCEVVTNFSEANLGCKERVASGLDWVFSEANEAIIIEDDCLPDPSFFSFSEQLLARYRDDERIMHINGCNFLSDRISLERSYYFSRYTFGGYGWASWSRAWQHFDKDMKSWPEFKRSGMLAQLFEASGEQDFWRGILDRTYAGEIDTWDFQWFYAVWTQGGLSIVPRVNLVSNLGFRPDATHTNTPHERDWLSNLPRGSIDEIQHPDFVIRNREADNQIARAYYGCGEEKQDFKLPTGWRYYWAALKYKLGQLRSSA